MKKITKIKTRLLFFVLSLLFISSNAFAQFQQYGAGYVTGMNRVGYILYDQKVENRIFACIADQYPRIYVSEDNGQTWRTLYSFPLETSGYIKHGNMKLSRDGKKLLFCFGNIGIINDAELRGVYSLDIETKEIRNYPVPSIEDNPDIVSYDVYDDNTILIHTSYLDMTTWSPRTKAFYTNDGGSSWTMVYYSEKFDTVHLNNVAISLDNPAKLFLARSHSPGDVDGGFLVSKDAGETWTEHMRGITFHPIAFHPNNPNDITIGTWIASGSHMEGVFRSTDGGDTWNLVEVPEFVNQILDHVTDIKYFPGQPNKMLITEENEMFYTEDGGNLWERHPTSITIGTKQFFVLGAEINPFNHDKMYIFEDDRIVYTSDMGQNYNVFLGMAPGLCTSVSAGTENNEDILYYINSKNERVYRNNLTTNVETYVSSNSCEIVMADPTMASRAFMVNTASNKLYYLAADNTLHEVPGTAANVKGILRDPANASSYWVAMNGSIAIVDISDPESITVSAITTPDNGSFVSGMFMPSSGGIYISKGDKVYKSTDGGSVWTEKSSGLGSDVITSMSVNPFDENEFIIAAGNNLYKSTDAAESWSLSGTGFSVNKVSFSPKTDGHIAAGIYDNDIVSFTNVIYSTDNGATWNEIGNEKLRYATSTGMDFVFDTDNIRAYIASSDMGRISYQFSTEDVEECNPARSLMVSISAGCTATLEWQAPEGNPNATYNVYRDGAVIASAVGATTYEDSDFTEGEHTWSVKAICGSEESEAVSRTESCIANKPARDINVAMANIIGVGDCGATITWNTPSGVIDGTITYNLYRDGQLIGSALTARSFVDDDFATGEHEWCVKAVYGSDESEGNCMIAECLLVCDSPRELSVEVSYMDSDCNAVLTWTYPEGYETATYNVYRDGVKISEGQAEMTFEDSDFACGEHEWSVATICGDTESAFATIRSYCSACEDPTNLDIEEANVDGNYSVVLTWNTPDEVSETGTIFHEGFEEGIPSTWSNMDKDGDGHKWVANFDEPYIYDASFSRLEGEYVYSLREYIDQSDWNTYKLSPDNWLITPQINLTTGNASLKFFAALVNAWWEEAYYEVYISATGTDYEDFTLLYSETIAASGDVWYERNIDLSGYSGNVYIAFRNLNESEDRTFGMRIDEVSVIENPYTYNIYRDGTEIATGITGTSYADNNISAETHEWCVKRICAFGESQESCINEAIGGIGGSSKNQSVVYPNPTTGTLTIENGGNTITTIQVLDVTGKVLQTRENVNTQKTTIDLSRFTNGVYFIKVDGKLNKVVKK